jgi:hypothetical protein
MSHWEEAVCPASDLVDLRKRKLFDGGRATGL